MTAASGSNGVRTAEGWAHLDLNQGPHPYQGCALTNLSYGPVKPPCYTMAGHTIVGWPHAC